MDDLERVAFIEHRRTVSIAGDDIPVEFNDHASGPDLQFLEEPGNAQSVDDLFFFSVDTNLHLKLKNRIATTHRSGQGIRF
jgi:hypothetical protein